MGEGARLIAHACWANPLHVPRQYIVCGIHPAFFSPWFSS